MIQSAYKTGFNREIKRGRTVFLPKYINHHIKPFNKNHSVFQPLVDIGLHRQSIQNVSEHLQSFHYMGSTTTFPHQLI